FLLLLLACLTFSSAHASPFDKPLSDSPFGSSSQSIPPVDQAMALSVEKNPTETSLIVHFSLLDHVYLYRPQLKLAPLDANKNTLAFVTPPALPEGTAHE